ncbi:GM12037 [Drosophila sechellia]|uniref:GM12037 n=1 Tax=Drosophila sechellia TaxID=7238 RepID=B4IJ60_DROSE|nr:GM12037 [Drosophila sechellia]
MHALYCTLCSPYYETRANYNGLLKAQKTRVNELEAKVSAAKLTYNEALKNLEQISEDIHRQRQQRNNLLNYEAMLRQVDTVDTLTAGLERSSCGTDADRQDLEAKAAAEEQEHVEDEEEEYLRMPERLGHHECPHLLADFEAVLTFPQKLAGGMHKSASTGAAADGEAGLGPLGLHAPYEVKSGSGSLASGSASVSTSAGGAPADNDIEQWTEIRLSHSDSTSSSYSNQSLLEQQGLDSTGGAISRGPRVFGPHPGIHYGSGNGHVLSTRNSFVPTRSKTKRSPCNDDIPRNDWQCIQRRWPADEPKAEPQPVAVPLE